MESFMNLWHSNADYTLWEAIWIGTIFFILNLGLSIGTWFTQKEIILECAYSKSKRKRIRQEFKTSSFSDKLLLRRLAKNGTKYNPIISISLVINYINIISVFIGLIGYIGAIITRGNGWAMILTMCYGFVILCLSGIIHLVLDLIFVPSERRRYGIKDKQ